MDSTGPPRSPTRSMSIALTLLVLPLVDLATDAETGRAGPGRSSTGTAAQLLGFAVSFLVISQFWDAHRRLLGTLDDYDERLARDQHVVAAARRLPAVPDRPAVRRGRVAPGRGGLLPARALRHRPAHAAAKPGTSPGTRGCAAPATPGRVRDQILPARRHRPPSSRLAILLSLINRNAAWSRWSCSVLVQRFTAREGPARSGDRVRRRSRDSGRIGSVMMIGDRRWLSCGGPLTAIGGMSGRRPATATPSPSAPTRASARAPPASATPTSRRTATAATTSPHYDLDAPLRPGHRPARPARRRSRAKATQDLSRFNLDLAGSTCRAVTVDGAAGRRSAATAASWSSRRPRGLAQRRAVHHRRHLRRRAAADRQPELGTGGWLATADGAVALGQPESARSWYPVNDHPRDKATYDWRSPSRTG